MANSTDIAGFFVCTDRGNEYLCRRVWPTITPQRSNSGSTVQKRLKNMLKDAQIEVVGLPGIIDFVPMKSLGEIINESSMSELLNELKSCRHLSTAEKARLARRVCVAGDRPPYCSFRKVVAILVRMRRAEDIPIFIRSEYGDASLLHMNHVGTYNAFPVTLEPQQVQDFRRLREKFNSPFFTRPKGGIYHYVLHPSTILPFNVIRECDSYKDDDDAVAGSDSQDADDRDHTGGYGVVRYVEIHPGSYAFGKYGAASKKHAFAVKQLSTRSEKEFMDEVKALLRFAHCNDKQLVKLLATYELRSDNQITYNLIFPWADNSVRTMWKQNSHVNRQSTSYIKWIAREAAAIAESLAYLHIEYSDQLDPNEKEKYGRHGDIKAANLLVYCDGSGPNGLGPIYISDFGLSRFHRQESRSKVHPKAASPSYRPPEFDVLNSTLSRKSDIWSLGAFFLEFMTWYLEDWKSVRDDFPNAREEVDHQSISSDIFFRLEDFNGSKRAIVKPKVRDWAERLHRHKDCTECVHDLLNLVMDQMLVANRDDRIEAVELSKELSSIYEKCKKRPEYCTRKCSCSARPK